MFDSLKDKLQSVFSGLGKRGALSEADVDAALREVRLALLDADVALPVVKSFMARIRGTGGWGDGAEISAPGSAGDQNRP